MYRIFYKRTFGTQKEAQKAMSEVVGIATNPKLAQAKSGAYLVVLYEHENRKRIDDGVQYYKDKGLTVYAQEF